MNDNLPNTFNIDAPGVLEAVKKTLCPPNATNEEFAIFVEFCRATGLNPYKREVWFIKTEGYFSKKHNKQVEGKCQIMTGINGYLTIANSQPQYDGMDEPEFHYDKQGFLTKCVVRAWRKDRSRPAVGVAFFSEYSTGIGNWETKPHIMLAKVAKSIALREAFIQVLGGTYTEDEMEQAGPAYKVVKADVKTIGNVAKQLIDHKAEPIVDDRSTTLDKLIDAFAEVEVNQVQVEEFMQKIVEEFTDEEIGNLRKIYKAIKSGKHTASEWFVDGLTGEL